MIGGNDDDMKLLMAKRFLLAFESGVIVIKHWRINNLIRKDWHRDTRYTNEMNQLLIKDNGAYTELGNDSLTKLAHNKQINKTNKQTNSDDIKNNIKKMLGEKCL